MAGLYDATKLTYGITQKQVLLKTTYALYIYQRHGPYAVSYTHLDVYKRQI